MENSTADKGQVAMTIAKQIGNRAFYMMGAKNLMSSENTLVFKIGRNDMKVNMVKIELTPADLYKMSFLNVRGMNIKTISELDGIYADMMHNALEMHTGMRTRL